MKDLHIISSMIFSYTQYYTQLQLCQEVDKIIYPCNTIHVSWSSEQEIIVFKLELSTQAHKEQMGHKNPTVPENEQNSVSLLT